LSEEALVELREIVAKLHSNGGPIPFQELVALGALDHEGMTIDLAASETLGAPMVVLHSSPTPALEGLSPRELEVAVLVAEGLSNKVIADRLCLTVGTVKDHVHRILEKTGLSSRAGIAGRLRRP